MAKARYTLEWADFDREPQNGLVDGPTWDDVRAIVEHLAGCDAGFVVLRRSESDFIQTARAGNGLIVEYRAPKAAAAHYEIADAPVTADEAVALFRAWFDSPGTIAEHGEWQPVRL